MRKGRSFPTTLRSSRVSTWHKKEYIDFYKKIQCTTPNFQEYGVGQIPPSVLVRNGHVSRIERYRNSKCIFFSSINNLQENPNSSNI